MKDEEERIRKLEDEEADRKLKEEINSMHSQFEKERINQMQKEVGILFMLKIRHDSFSQLLFLFFLLIY